MEGLTGAGGMIYMMKVLSIVIGVVVAINVIVIGVMGVTSVLWGLL